MLQKLRSLILHFSRQLRILLKRKDIFLVNDREFDNLVKELAEDKQLHCSICGRLIKIHEVAGFSFQRNENELIVYCNNENCHNIKGG